MLAVYSEEEELGTELGQDSLMNNELTHTKTSLIKNSHESQHALGSSEAQLDIATILFSNNGHNQSCVENE